jgi:hypothetical protein
MWRTWGTECGNIVVDGKIILGRVLEKQNCSEWASCGPEEGHMLGCSEDGIEHSIYQSINPLNKII